MFPAIALGILLTPVAFTFVSILAIC